MTTKKQTQQFTPIAIEEFETNYRKHGVPSPFGNAVRALELGQAIKTPCVWNHRPGCSGRATVSNITTVTGRTFRMACRNGTVYVMRIE